MAEKETQPSAPTLPVENATAPVAEAIEKPEAALTKTTSRSSDSTGHEAMSPIEDENPTRPELQRTTTQEFPPFREQVIVMTAILLAIFLIALVRFLFITQT